MGLLESVAGAVLAKAGQTPDQQHGFLSGILQLINHPEVGGVQGLIEKFKAAGMGHLADAWVSQGPNPPVSAQQIQSVLPADQLRAFAQKLGLNPDEAAKHLADMLPHVVDNLTPEGKLPAGGLDASAALAMLKQKLFGN